MTAGCLPVGGSVDDVNGAGVSDGSGGAARGEVAWSVSQPYGRRGTQGLCAAEFGDRSAGVFFRSPAGTRPGCWLPLWPHWTAPLNRAASVQQGRLRF